MVKSGETVVKITLTECEIPLMVPVTEMLYEFPGPGKAVPANMDSVAMAVPSGLRVTLAGLTDQLLHPGWAQRGGLGVDSDTVPLSPLRLVNLMVEVAVEPARIVRLVGFAEIRKSGARLVANTAG